METRDVFGHDAGADCLETFLVEWKRAAYNHAEYLPEPLKPS